MTDVLLKELSSSDINWMVAAGQQQEVAPGTVLIQERVATKTLYILLDGTLTVTISQSENNPLARAFSQIEGSEAAVREVTRLSSGEVVGEIPFLTARSPVTTIKALERSRLISIPQHSLAEKLKQDVGFAARFYRAIAILISHRLQKIIREIGRSKLAQGQPLRDVLFVLSALNDSDIDWMIATGQRQKIVANTVLIREGGPVDALYVVLDGILTASVFEAQGNPLTRAFAALEGNEIPGQEITRLSKGEMIGENPFIDADLPAATVRAWTDALVLALPRRQLATKLQQDIGFSARFYRVIATLLSYRLQGLLNRLGYGRRVYSKGQSLDQTEVYDDELDAEVLDQIAIASTRFEWMLDRLKE